MNSHSADVRGKSVFRSLVFVCLVLIKLDTATASAKGHREIVGQVQSYSFPSILPGKLFPVASIVRVYTQDMELVSEVITDESGYFSVSDLKPGTYTFAVTALEPRTNSGRFFPLAQSVTLHQKDDAIVDFILRYVGL